jgi:hypothetical protein
MSYRLVASIGDGAVNVADSCANKILGCAHLEIGKAEVSRVRGRTGRVPGSFSQKQREHDHHGQNSYHGHENGTAAGITRSRYRGL